jgi:hypothetical protein
MMPGNDQPQAVGSEQSQAVRGRLLDDRALQCDARGTRLLEAGGQHDGGGDAGDAACLDDRRYRARGDRDDHEVGNAGERGDVRKAGMAGDLVGARVDRPDRAQEPGGK